MSTMTELERLVAVETKMDTVIEGVKDLQKKFDLVMPTVVSHPQFSEYKQAQAFDMAELKKDMLRTKLKNSITVWITGTLSAIFGVILTILVQSYLSK